MSIDHRPNNALRQQRLVRGWSLQRVADELSTVSMQINGKRPGVNADMIGEWERGVKMPSPFYREKLCQIYSTTTDQLGLLAPRTAAPIGNDDMKRKRREVLQLLSLGGAALILPFPDLDWERIESVVAHLSQIDEVALRDLETMNAHYWSIYRASSSKQLMLDGVRKQLKMLVGLLRASHSASAHKQLSALASDLAQLSGEIFFDANDYDAAQSCYVFAAAAAKEAAAYDLWACALVRHAFLPIFDTQYEDALPLLRQAQYLAQHGDSSLVTRFWVAAVEADAQSGTKQLAACQNALERANGVLNVAGGMNGGWLRFDGLRLPEQRGTCFVRLGRPDLAEPALQKALAQHPAPTRRRGMILNDLALATLQRREVDQACAYAHEVITIATQGSSGVLKKGIHTLRTELEPFVRTDAVKRLDQHMRLLS
jgi:tetratricopeptide (TPR) repeat protein